jgi:hypothetical protein
MAELQILKPEHIKISDIKSNPDKFWPNPEYQRSDAWKPEKRQKLLESIFKELSIGILYIRKQENNDKFEILDGQQRIQTIKKFLNGEINTPASLRGFADKNYADLEKDNRRLPGFLDFPIWYIPIYGGTEDEVADIFIRLQEGQPLNTPEKLNAIQSSMKPFVIDASKHKTFKDSNVDEFRFAHRLLAAQCIYFYLNSKPPKKEFPNPPRYKELYDMYQKWKGENISNRLHKEIFGTLDFIYQSLKSEIKVIKKKGDITVLFELANYVKNNLALPHEVFRATITNFITEVENAEIKNDKPTNSYEEYKQLRSSGATKENFTRKFELILMEFEKIENLVKKDSQRFPDWGTTLRVYYRDNRICSYCGKLVDFNDISIDHVEQHQKGGSTKDIKNLRLVHKGKCHDALEKQKVKVKNNST